MKRALLLPCLIAASCCVGGAAVVQPHVSPADVSARALSNTEPTVDAETQIRVSAAASDGAVWAIGWRRRPGVLRWDGARWEARHEWESWPGNPLDLVADPARPGESVSIWYGTPEDGGAAERLQVWRHSPSEGAARLASFPNPTWGGDHRSRSRPRATIGVEGDVWLTFAAPFLLRVPSAGGEPLRIDLPADAFTPRIGNQVREILPVAFTADGAESGWLWSVHHDQWRAVHGELRRPWRLVEGKAWPPEAPVGLPAEARVVALWREASGDMVWSLEGGGLWRVDAAGAKASPLPSPPGAWRILDWRRWPGGREIALVFPELPRADGLAGEVWAKIGGGVWKNFGPSGDLGGRVLRGDQRVMRPRDWVWRGDLLLAGGFEAGLVMVDLAVAEPRARVLDWRERQDVARPRRLFEVGGDRVLLQGDTTAEMAFGRSRAEAWRADDVAASGAKPLAWTFDASPIRAPDGRLWYLRTSGAGAPAVRHWDGGRWHEWPTPEGRARWLANALIVDEAGRVTLWEGQLAKSAWVRDEREPQVWRRWSSAQALFQARAAERPVSQALPVIGELGARGPVYSGDGRALLGSGGAAWYFDGMGWSYFRSDSLGGGFVQFGFLADGAAPFVHANGRLRCLTPGGAWALVTGHPEHDELRRAQARPRLSHDPRWQAVLSGRADLARVSAAHPDARGEWWFVEAGVLRRLRGDDVVDVFEADAASPFRAARGAEFQEVLDDPLGHRFFVRSPFVLLTASPGPEVELRVAGVEAGPDRRLEVAGADLSHVEWRLGEGAWRRADAGSISLRELAPGSHRVEARGVNRRLDSGPVVGAEFSVRYDRAARIGELASALRDPSRRADAVARLMLHGEAEERVLRAALASEQDEDRRWWLRAALQAIEDAREVERAP